jgi:hypothetical protein
VGGEEAVTMQTIILTTTSRQTTYGELIHSHACERVRTFGGINSRQIIFCWNKIQTFLFRYKVFYSEKSLPALEKYLLNY